MTDQEIKSVYEREIERINARLRHGKITRERYEERAESVRRWAERKYADEFYAKG